MKILIIKIGASGDVLRTTPLLEEFKNEEVHWLTTEKNSCLVGGNRIFTNVNDVDLYYDWIINLEEEPDIFNPILKKCSYKRYTGPYLSDDGTVTYESDFSKWFDMSRISRFGKEKSDELKWNNKQTYQELLFEMLKLNFNKQKYKFIEFNKNDRILHGDIGIVISDDTVWPTKNWYNINKCGDYLINNGYKVNYLKRRNTIRQYVSDITGHKIIICGDSLPMHICISNNIPCVSTFTCTSPWEIETYGIVNKVVSPILKKHFYKRDYNEEVSKSIDEKTVIKIIEERLNNEK